MSNDKSVRNRMNGTDKSAKTRTDSIKESNEIKHSSSVGEINHSTPIPEESFHKVRDSLLSSASGFSNYRGILNLCVVLLVMSTSRLVIENLIKYGLLVRFDILILFIKDPTAWPSALAFVCSNLFILFALWLEKNLANDKINEKIGTILCCGNITTALVLPAVYLWYRATNPIASFIALAIYTCISMKLVSYYQINKSLRAEMKLSKLEKSSKKKEVNFTTESPVKDNATKKVVTNPITHECKSYSVLDEKAHSTKKRRDSNTEEIISHSNTEPLVTYPNNLNLKAPTLCYEINFPRTKRIRKRFLFRRVSEIAFLTTLQIILLQQWIVPIIQNSKDPYRESNILKIIERVLKLAVPNHVIWLLGFYGWFHSYLNILAELLRFGDRQFYKDWWNAESVVQFWQNWNIPVHSFCLRHIYKPLLLQGVTKFQSSLIVFFISAFLHEYLVSIPLRMFRLWSFFGMILQVPFAAFVNKFLHGNYGNMAVWVSLIIGQPAAIMMYIHDYYIDYFRNQN